MVGLVHESRRSETKDVRSVKGPVLVPVAKQKCQQSKGVLVRFGVPRNAFCRFRNRLVGRGVFAANRVGVSVAIAAVRCVNRPRAALLFFKDGSLLFEI